MERNPSLHILRSDLIKVLKKTMPKGVDLESLADTIFEKSIPYQLKTRYLIKGNADTNKRVEKVLTAQTDTSYSVERFNGLLAAIRQQAGHRFIPKLVKGTTDWTNLREVLQIALDFCKAFKFTSTEEGLKRFLTLGLNLMGKKYALNKYKYLSNKIADQHEAETILEQDPKEDETVIFWETWKAKMLHYAGTELDILKPELFVNMVYGRQEADELKADYDDYITAQFEQLAMFTNVPELTQFYGDNAKHRYNKYMATKKTTVNKPLTKKEQEKEAEYNLPAGLSKEEAAYFKTLRQRKATS